MIAAVPTQVNVLPCLHNYELTNPNIDEDYNGSETPESTELLSEGDFTLLPPSS